MKDILTWKEIYEKLGIKTWNNLNNLKQPFQLIRSLYNYAKKENNITLLRHFKLIEIFD